MLKNLTLPQPGTNIFRKTQNTKNAFSLRSISEIGFQCQSISYLKYKVLFCFCQKAQCATSDEIMHIFKTLKFLSIDCGELLPWFWRDPESKHVGIPFWAQKWNSRVGTHTFILSYLFSKIQPVPKNWLKLTKKYVWCDHIWHIVISVEDPIKLWPTKLSLSKKLNFTDQNWVF